VEEGVTKRLKEMEQKEDLEAKKTLEELTLRFQCAICLELNCFTLTLPCYNGHYICFKCAHDWMDDKKKIKQRKGALDIYVLSLSCPECKLPKKEQVVDSSLGELRQLDNGVRDLFKAVAKLSNDKIKMNKFIEGKGDCPFIELCGQSNVDLSHVRLCGKTKYQCAQKCGVMLDITSAVALDEHSKVCTNYACKGCGVGGLKRCEKEKHDNAHDEAKDHVEDSIDYLRSMIQFPIMTHNSNLTRVVADMMEKLRRRTEVISARMQRVLTTDESGAQSVKDLHTKKAIENFKEMEGAVSRFNRFLEGGIEMRVGMINSSSLTRLALEEIEFGIENYGSLDIEDDEGHM
jgi:hypothetical protein